MARAPVNNNQRATQAQPSQRAAQPTALPPVLQGLMTAAPQPPVMAPGRGLAGAMPSLAGAGAPQMGFGQVPSYQVGGAIGPGGQPIRPAGLQPQTNPQEPLDPQMVEMQIQKFVGQNPQQVAQIQQEIMALLSSGEMTQQELNMVVQMATAALRNPALYPQLRQAMVQQGIVDEEDLPLDFDQGLLITIVIAGRTMQANVGGQNMLAGGTPAMAGAAPIQSMKDGGRVRGEASEPVMIEAHTGEYVIPKHVVDMKGREFFDRMLEQYAGKASDNEGGTR
jgi:hypothetical protein